MLRLRLILGVLALLATSIARAQNPILDWNATMRQVIQADPATANPGWSTRSMAMLNAAMYDVYQSFNRTHQPFHYTDMAPDGVNREAALAQVAYRLTLDCYDQPGLITAAHTAALNAIADSPDKLAGIAFGNNVALSYMTMRSGDNSDINFLWPVNHGPGHWEPDPMHPGQSAWGPKWGLVTEFVPNPNPYTYVGVPNMDTPEYKAAFEQVRDKGALTNSTRTADEEHIGLFWAYDRPTMGPPGVLFSRALEEISNVSGNTEEQSARLFAMASVAMADAAIVAWENKFVADFWRPVTGIRRAAEDGNDDTEAILDWVPLGAPGNDPNITTDDFTPPFPAWPSGHATMGGALFETLRDFYGSDAMAYTLTSDELLPGNNTRSFTSFSQAEWENGISRVFLGVHWEFDSTDGIAIGNQIADWVAANHFQAVAIPEPTSIALLAVALFAGGLWIRRR